jgi:aspartyl-tRNA(Asn)/glutamyl-tRNA(Gln) amidotransferase subunit A
VAVVLDRLATEPYNAFTAIDPAALDRAAAIDAAVVAGRQAGPLAGVPVALKDIIDHAGRTTTAGSSFWRHTATASATVVSRLDAAGAVIVGRTGLHEFALGFSSENDWFGPVLNPWDPATSPGGSSGGSAAAVAAGLVPIAVGTDTGGSIRVPAALCGCVGLKVTHGRVPLTGVFPLAPSRDTVGPLATTVADAAALYAVMAGDDPADPWSHPVPVVAPGPTAELTGLRIGIPHPWVDRPLSSRVQAGFERFLDDLAAHGATAVPLSAPGLDPTAMPRAAYAEVATVHREWIAAQPERYGPAIRDRIFLDLGHTADAVVAADAWRHGVARTFDRLFTLVDLIATPTTPTLRKVIGEDLVEAGAAPEPHRPALSWFTNLVNQAGLPALALPTRGDGRPGPTPSIQLIAPAWTEHRLLEVGLALEERGLVGFTPPPR